MITVDSGIKSVAYFMVVSRPAIAGYDTSSMIESARDLTILARLLLFLILIIGNIVFMNFMIMVAVSGSYENCMERKTQLINWTKLEMIEECAGGISLPPRLGLHYCIHMWRQLLPNRLFPI